MAVISRVIQRRRKVLGINQEEVENRVPMSYKYFSKVERGISNPSFVSLVKIGQALETTGTKLFHEAEQEYLAMIKNDEKE
ncbi:helix-turn-helix domain-containing protein [Bacillus shivajii]|uniref:helix-turn-helix domain-containing protein n=1 Tax=Bacillus shivajii TaxID=1983719 RepID=UPI001CFAD63C|nr:helix-turn-helix transcriptional regulator [Bacillus shivajii]UCZ52934.1 helix-turn-helix domain-containing protein [Bacillus shivajii]